MSALLERIAGEAGAAQQGLPHRDTRLRALEALTRQGLPSARDENWRYANLRSLERQRFTPASGMVPASLELPPALPGFTRCVFVDGHFDRARSAAPGPPLAAAALERTLRQGPDERFSLLNAALAAEVARVKVAAGTERVEFLFVASAPAGAGASYPRLEVEVEPGAGLELIERHLSAGSEGGFVTSAVEVHLAAGAHCTHYRVQDLNPRSILFDTLGARLDADAHYRLHALHTGGQAARSTLALTLGGERARVDLAVAALGERSQVQDTYARVEHAARATRTHQLFRGIAAGRSRVAFNGKIVVAHSAADADSQQSLRGLLAGPEAEIDVRPQLEIYTDAVRCSHGASVGKLDEQMLFYLLARGLARESALRLLKWAFLEDVIAGIGQPALRRQLEARLARLLPEAAPEELP